MNKTLRRIIYFSLLFNIIGTVEITTNNQVYAKSRSQLIRINHHLNVHHQIKFRKPSRQVKLKNHRGRRIIRHHRKSRRALSRKSRIYGLYSIHLTKRQTHDANKLIQPLRRSRYVNTGIHDLSYFFRSNYRNSDHTHADMTFGAVRIHNRNYLITFNSNRKSHDFGDEYLYRFNARPTFQSDAGFTRRLNVKTSNQGYVFKFYRYGKIRYQVNIRTGAVKSNQRMIKPIAKILTD